jgi:hypothetical protein
MPLSGRNFNRLIRRFFSIALSEFCDNTQYISNEFRAVTACHNHPLKCTDDLNVIDDVAMDRELLTLDA